MIRVLSILHTLSVLLLTASSVQAAGTETADNTLLGQGAGGGLTSGAKNTFIGVNAGAAASTHAFNTFVGDQAGAVTTSGGNTFIGSSAGEANTDGGSNTFLGRSTGFTNTAGSFNVFVGTNAGFSNDDGSNNSFVGQKAGFLNDTGTTNTFIGSFAGEDNDGNANTFLGKSAGQNNAVGGANTFVGESAGFNATGSQSVFLGAGAGFNETGSNRLYIENSINTDPLIYGEFDNDIVGVNGILGVGTQSPIETVDVFQDGAARFQLSSFSSTATDAAQYIQRRARGTQAAPAPVQSGDNIGLFSFRGMRPNGIFSGSKAFITVQATENWGNSSNGTSIKFGTTQNGTSTFSTVMEITHDQRVLINGTQLDVPDYVFEDEYDLMPLADLKAFIHQHKHLPDIASAEQVEREGVDLGGSQMALLQKIEELTLYTLRQQTEIDELRELVNRLVANDQLAAVN